MPRVWKWLVPAFAMVALVPMAAWANMVAERNGWAWMMWCSCFLIGVMPFFGIQAWAAFAAYFRHMDVQDLVDRRNALATTAEVRQFEYARTMHPETVKLLLLQRKTIWRIKEAKPGEMADWVLDADPSVRVEFVEHVLDNSTLVKMMPLNMLSEGAYTFDPGKMVTDREQYHALHRLLINRGMATEAFGNQPGQWIEPWTPELVAGRWGIRFEEEIEDAPTQPPPAERVAARNLGEDKKPPPVVDETLSDEAMEKINALNEARDTLSVKDYMEFCKKGDMQ